MKRTHKQQNLIYTNYENNEKIIHLIHNFIQIRIDHYFFNSKLELIYNDEASFIHSIRQQVKPDLYCYIATLLTQYSNYSFANKINDLAKLVDIIGMKWDIVINAALEARIQYIQSNHIHSKTEYMANVSY